MVVSAGGAANGGRLTKDTEANIDDSSTVSANGDVEVLALSDELIAPITATLGASELAAIAGAADIFTLPVTTTASITAAANVTAQGSVVVNADDSADVHYVTGQSSLSAAAAAGASAGLVSLEKNTQAFVDSGAHVTALGLRPAASTRSGTFDVTYTPDPDHIPGLLGSLVVDVLGILFNNPIRTLANALGFSGDLSVLNITPVSSPTEDPDLTGSRTSTPNAVPIRGVAVSATSAMPWIPWRSASAPLAA